MVNSYLRTVHPGTLTFGAKLNKGQKFEYLQSLARDIRIFTLLEKMTRQQTQILDTVHQVFGVVSKLESQDGGGPTELPDDIHLPVTSIEELELVETGLQEPGCFNGLVTYLTLQGGITRSDMSKRVMKHCMSNQLALQFNWFGKKGKRAFGKLKLAKAVQKAVMKCKKCTAAEVELDCREWFRSACDRDGGRKRRQKTNEGVPETPTE
ncbi:uncharacterized protein LOC132743705 isoform X1 [Ruditapes philippinarum]|uniref:uncharacterized protein LOC132743705 isoform X1 n=1 Tax=Ruditapes philippinarum TaxID=129788 RepID=UPI00295AF7A1|nr:uncharacterized protein LOC132743705 isoform X1 [Ruditapes philippinarum]